MTAVQDQAAALSYLASLKARTSDRLEDLEWLLEGGVWPPTACARVGWTVDAARQAATRHGRTVAAVLQGHVAAQRRAA